MRIEIEIQPELPELNKCLFCLPLRGGLVACGFVQLILNIIYGAFLCDQYSYAYGPEMLERTIIFIIFLLWTIFDIVFCVLLIRGTLKRKINSLELCFKYMKVKVPVYTLLVVIGMIISFSYIYPPWLIERHFDDYMVFTLFDHPDFGFLVCVIQLYLLMLIKGMILDLERNTLDTDSYHKSLSDDFDQEVGKEKEEKKIDDVC